MGVSWSAQVLRQAGDTLSGSGAFLIFFSLKTWRTSSSVIFSAAVGYRGVVGGVNGCVERCSRWVKVIKIICQFLILQSAGGWSCNS